MKPKRIQRKRTKGYRLPEGAVYVGRPTKWGNPFVIGECIENGFAHDEAQARQVCVDFYRDWLKDEDVWSHGKEQRQFILDHVADLRGRDLACWCPLDQPCHADALLQLANEGGEQCAV